MTTNRYDLPDEVLQRVGDLEPITCVSRGQYVTEARRANLELRAADDGTYYVAGYATTFDTRYDVAGGPDAGGWTERIAAGAFTKSLREKDDVRFLLNHEGLPLARTKSGTMRLEQDDLGLRVEVPNLDPANPDSAALISALKRGDVDQMSFAFRVIRQEWDDDYTQRTITEVETFDVSAVTYPANESTIIGLRTEDPADEPEKTSSGGYPLSLALAERDALSTK
jgi:HK97 family phage prohead protease